MNSSLGTFVIKYTQSLIPYAWAWNHLRFQTQSYQTRKKISSCNEHICSGNQSVWVRVPQVDLSRTFVIFLFPGLSVEMWPHGVVFLGQNFSFSVKVSVHISYLINTEWYEAQSLSWISVRLLLCNVSSSHDLLCVIMMLWK